MGAGRSETGGGRQRGRTEAGPGFVPGSRAGLLEGRGERSMEDGQGEDGWKIRSQARTDAPEAERANVQLYTPTI